MAGDIINDTDTTTPVPFGTCETACGIVADLVGDPGFSAWWAPRSDSFNGFSGLLWACIELARYAEKEIADTYGGWEAFGADFYGTTEAIAEAMRAAAPAADTDALKAAVKTALGAKTSKE